MTAEVVIVVVTAVVEVDTVDTMVEVDVVENTPPNGANLKIVDKGSLNPGPLQYDALAGKVKSGVAPTTQPLVSDVM